MSFAPNGRLWFSDRKHIGYFDKNDKPVFVSRPANDDSVFAILATRRGDVVYSEGYSYNINRLKKSGRFKPDGAGTEKLVERKCLVCHDARRLLLSRRSDWTPSIGRMHAYRDIRKVEALTAEETDRLVRYFNNYYGVAR